MRRNVKHKAPSRIRYEQSHPTVSCRVPVEIYERLQTVRKAEGKSFADILKIGLGGIEPKMAKAQMAWKEGYREGCDEGYADAERVYEVTYACNVCKRTLAVTSQAEKEAIKSYMEEHGWGHDECLRKAGNYP